MNKMRPELSKKNPYWLPKHRYYELKHHCLQYPDWKRAYQSISLDISGSRFTQVPNTEPSDSVGNKAAVLAEYDRLMKEVENACKLTDQVMWRYILVGVTEGVGYTYLKNVMGIPCGKDFYYEMYHRFYYIFNESHNLQVLL